jgi:hypothetical protein
MPDYREQTDRIKDKLERARKEDPCFQMIGASRHRYAIGPPLDEREVAAFEETYRISLPACFRSFLTQVGNGSPVATRVVIRPEGFYPLSEQEIDAYEKNHGVSVGASERAFLAKVRNGDPVDQGMAAGPGLGLFPLERCRYLDWLEYPPLITPDLSVEAWEELSTIPDKLLGTSAGSEIMKRAHGGILVIGGLPSCHLSAIIVGGAHAGRVIWIDDEDLEEMPHYYRAAKFLDWHERWLSAAALRARRRLDPPWEIALKWAVEDGSS